MKPRSAEAVRRLIRKYQRILRLEDWDIYYVEGELPEDPDDCASVSHNNENHIAKIRLNWGNFDENINTLEQTVVHELCHLHMWQQRELVYEILEQYVFDIQAQKVYAKLLEEHEERLVERMAWIAVTLITSRR